MKITADKELKEKETETKKLESAIAKKEEKKETKKEEKK